VTPEQPKALVVPGYASKRSRSEGRRALALRLERETKGGTHRSTNLPFGDGIKAPYEFYTLRNAPARPRAKKRWSPEREASRILAVFAQQRDDKRWVQNLDHAERMDRKAARQLLRAIGGKVGVK
jgi:hypothetical protein